MTKESKHTPGPWRMGAQFNKNMVFARGNISRMKNEKRGTTLYSICQITTGFDDIEDQANAELIAKAPLLPEAIECLKWAVDSMLGLSEKARAGGIDCSIRDSRNLIARYEAKP